MKWIMLVSILAVLTGLLFFFAPTEADYKNLASLDLINNSYNMSEINAGEKVFYELQSVIDPDNLPEKYKSLNQTIIRSGTPYINAVLDNWELLNPEQQASAAKYLARPTNDTYYVSPDSIFAIHYDTSGFYIPPIDDIDSNGIYDYVENLAIYADSAHRYYVTHYQFLLPPSDGDDYYDIYLLFTGNAYGYTVRGSDGDSAWGDYSSHMELHHNIGSVALPNDDPEGDVVGALKVTGAHEYFHAVQMAYAYIARPHMWWTEGSATFFEDNIFDEVNDNYSFLPYFFDEPDISLIDTANFGASWHDYSAFIWPSFLSEKYDVDFLRTILEYSRYVNPLPATDSALIPFSETVENIFPEFTLWNYFTDLAADTMYHDDAADYPPINIDHTIPQIPFSDDTGIFPPDAMAGNYIMAYAPIDSNGLLRINFDGYDYVEWGFSYVTFRGDSAFPTYNCEVDNDGVSHCGIYDFVIYDSMLFIPSVVSKYHKENPYLFGTSIYPFGDINGSSDINVFDITYLISHLYKGGPEAKFDARMGDTNCDGFTNLFDITYLIKFLYQDGAEPCSYRN